MAKSAFMKELTPSAELAKVVGAKPLPRTEVVKKLWAYIKKNKLQDTKNKRNINADEALKEVFGIESITKVHITLRNITINEPLPKIEKIEFSAGV